MTVSSTQRNYLTKQRKNTSQDIKNMFIAYSTSWWPTTFMSNRKNAHSNKKRSSTSASSSAKDDCAWTQKSYKAWLTTQSPETPLTSEPSSVSQDTIGTSSKDT